MRVGVIGLGSMGSPIARNLIEARHALTVYNRTLGSTVERVPAIGVGGRHLSLRHVDEALSLRIVREAIDRVVNFMDATAAPRGAAPAWGKRLT